MANKYVLSFEEACTITGDDANAIPKGSKSTIAFHKMEVIEKAQNKLDKFVPDYSDSSQRKWYCWLWFNPSVGAFVFYFTIYTYTYTNLGSRFCYKTEKTAEFMTKQHIGLLNEIMSRE